MGNARVFILLLLALLLLKAGKTQEAVPLLKQVVCLDPAYAGAYYHLGKTHSQQGCVDEAVGELEKAIALNPQDDDASYQLGRLHAKLGNQEKAQELFKIVNERKERHRQRYQEKVSGPN